MNIKISTGDKMPDTTSPHHHRIFTLHLEATSESWREIEFLRSLIELAISEDGIRNAAYRMELKS